MTISFFVKRETIAIPSIFVLIFSAINFINKDSDFEGITVVVIELDLLDNETTNEPIFIVSSDNEIKHPLSNFCIIKEKLRSSKCMGLG